MENTTTAKPLWNSQRPENQNAIKVWALDGRKKLKKRLYTRGEVYPLKTDDGVVDRLSLPSELFSLLQQVKQSPQKTETLLSNRDFLRLAQTLLTENTNSRSRALWTLESSVRSNIAHLLAKVIREGETLSAKEIGDIHGAASFRVRTLKNLDEASRDLEKAEKFLADAIAVLSSDETPDKIRSEILSRSNALMTAESYLERQLQSIRPGGQYDQWIVEALDQTEVTGPAKKRQYHRVTPTCIMSHNGAHLLTGAKSDLEDSGGDRDGFRSVTYLPEIQLYQIQTFCGKTMFCNHYGTPRAFEATDRSIDSIGRMYHPRMDDTYRYLLADREYTMLERDGDATWITCEILDSQHWNSIDLARFLMTRDGQVFSSIRIPWVRKVKREQNSISEKMLATTGAFLKSVGVLDQNTPIDAAVMSTYFRLATSTLRV